MVPRNMTTTRLILYTVTLYYCDGPKQNNVKKQSVMIFSPAIRLVSPSSVKDQPLLVVIGEGWSNELTFSNSLRLHSVSE